MNDKGIITLAVGKKYNRQAKYLARSCILHCPSLPRAIITDDCAYFKGLYDVVIQYTADMGNPFEVKLKLHLFTPFPETLFLDSDTLVYSDLRFMWECFDENSIVYTGNCVTAGEWYVNISQVLKHFNINWLPVFNSGIFLFKKDKNSAEIMNYAAKLYKNHDGIEVPYFRGKMLPDEPFFSIALAKFNQTPATNNYGRFGCSLIDAKRVKLNVTKGIAIFAKYDETVFPAIVHFVGGFIGRYFYFTEKLRLKFYFNSLDDLFSAIIAPIFYGLEFVKRKIKNRR